MMRKQPPPQPQLFYTRFNLDSRIPRNHPLRAVAATVDFDFVYDEVEHCYGAVGNESVPPPVILKLMFLLALENVASERRLFETLPLRLDWLWFLGMDLDSEIPDHSVLSKARTRWGVVAFRRFFQQVVRQCVEHGLVDGTKIFCDGSLVDADASRKSIQAVELVDLNDAADELERRLTLVPEGSTSPQATDEPGNDPVGKRTCRSTTDPDAAVVSKRGAGPARARYKTHRAVDDAHGVITATHLTPGDRAEAAELRTLVEQHEANTQTRVRTVVADTGYGTYEQYLMCADRGIDAHIHPVKDVTDATQQSKGLFPNTQFIWDPADRTYRCPAGTTLRRVQNRPDKNGERFAANAQVCAGCPLQSQCTKAPFRTVTRHLRQETIERMITQSRSEASRADLRRRKHFMERTFAVGARYGLKRCRWRRRWRAEIHDLLVATVQNIMTLVRVRIRPTGRALVAWAQRALSLPTFDPVCLWLPTQSTPSI
jgi:transposase